MSMMQKFRSFLNCDRGTVTADFVVLTAAVVGIALVTWQLVSGGILLGANTIYNALISAISG